ncbi:hypothetical protein HELRODRAFT_152908, partial [Helobdella robusta]|uniref:Uncharacterized protein n=1 Tax=Helobdella robusta TaxID=6412 RepID=T1EKY0_HELRO
KLHFKNQSAADKLSDSLNIISNEPALAMYRIQEHVRNSMPLLLEKRLDVVHLNKDIKGSIFDTEYAINAVKGMESSNVHFRNIQDLLKNSMFMKQQI